MFPFPRSEPNCESTAGPVLLFRLRGIYHRKLKKDGRELRLQPTAAGLPSALLWLWVASFLTGVTIRPGLSWSSRQCVPVSFLIWHGGFFSPCYRRPLRRRPKPEGQTTDRRPDSNWKSRTITATTSNRWIRLPPTPPIRPNSHRIIRTTKTVQSISFPPYLNDSDPNDLSAVGCLIQINA